MERETSPQSARTALRRSRQTRADAATCAGPVPMAVLAEISGFTLPMLYRDRLAVLALLHARYGRASAREARAAAADTGRLPDRHPALPDAVAMASLRARMPLLCADSGAGGAGRAGSAIDAAPAVRRQFQIALETAVDLLFDTAGPGRRAMPAVGPAAAATCADAGAVAGFDMADAARRGLYPADIIAGVAACLRQRYVNGNSNHSHSGGNLGDSDEALLRDRLDWAATMLLARQAPVLARTDVPPRLQYGGAMWALRQLAVENCRARSQDHWRIDDGPLVVANRLYVGATAALETVALAACAAGSGIRATDPRGMAGCGATYRPKERTYVNHAVDRLAAALAPSMALPAMTPAAIAPGPGWMARIDWSRFNGRRYIEGCDGAPRSTDAWLPAHTMPALGQLAALGACFRQPAESGPAAPVAGMLDIRHLLPAALERFADEVMISQGYAAMPLSQRSPLFLQALFDRWLATIMQAGAARFFFDALHDIVRPVAGGGHCADPARRTAGGLLQAAAVRHRLARKLFDAATDGAAAPRLSAREREWTLDVLCEFLMPALMRPDAAAMRFGSLEWSLFDIGIALAGPGHRDYTPDRLVALSQEVTLFAAPDADRIAVGDADEPVAGAYPVAVALRMAHCAGVIDMTSTRSGGVRRRIALSIALFRQRQLAARGEDSPFAQFDAALPSRVDAACALLKEQGFADPDREYTMRTGNYPMVDFARGGTLRSATAYPLYRYFMEQSLARLRRDGILTTAERAMLDKAIANLDGNLLQRRFEHDFDAAVDALTSGLLMPALEHAVGRLPVAEQQAWQCGAWEIRVPRTGLRTRRRWSGAGAWTGQAFDSDAMTRRTLQFTAGGALLVQLARAGETPLSYWVSLKPLRLARYDGDTRKLLQENLQVFFQSEDTHRQLVSLDPAAPLRYASIRRNDTRAAQAGGDGILPAIVHCLLGPRLALLRQAAAGVTDREAWQREMKALLLHLLPFYGCADALRSKDRIDSAALWCTLDLAAVVPLAGAAAGLVKSSARIGAAISRRELVHLAQAFLAGRVSADSAARTVATVMRLAGPARRLGLQALAYLDPGLRLGWRFTTIAGRFGRSGSAVLSRRLRNIDSLGKLRQRLNRSRRQGNRVYPEGGMWHVRPARLEHRQGERYMTFGAVRYSVMAIGGAGNVLVLRDGRGVRLADPESGLGYGPLMEPDGVRLWRRNPDASPAQSAGAPAPQPLRTVVPSASCRVKRAPGANASPCLLLPAAEFGDGFYRFKADSMGWRIYQRTIDAGAWRGTSLHGVDPAIAAYRSYTYVEGAVTNGYQYVWAQRLWRRNRENGLAQTGWDIGFPEMLVAQLIVRPPPAGSDDGIRHLLYIDFPIGQEGERALRNTYVVPYGSYADSRRVPMEMVEIGGQYYTFRLDYASLRPTMAITLRKASAEQQDIYHMYQSIDNANIGRDAGNRFTMLAQHPPMFSLRVGLALERVSGLIEDAARLLDGAPGTADRLLRHFARVKDAASVVRLRAGVAATLPQLADAMDVLKRERNRMLGFSQLDGDGPATVLGMGLPGSMRHAIDPQLVNKPLVYLNPVHVGEASADMLGATLLHELTHARLDTSDSMIRNSREEIYVLSGPDGYVDIDPLIRASRHADSDPVMHAATLENLIILFAYRHRNMPGVEAVFAGKSTRYQRRPDHA